MGITDKMNQMGNCNRKLVTNFWDTKTEANEETFAVTNLDLVYKVTDPHKVVENQTHLSVPQRKSFFHVLQTKTQLFKAKLSHWNSPPVNIELKEGAIPPNFASYRIL